MSSKVGPKGQVVIPKELRERLGILPGSSVAFRIRPEDDVLELHPAWADPVKDGPTVIQSLSRPGLEPSEATNDLLAMRREDESLWQEQFNRWSRRRSSSTPTR